MNAVMTGLAPVIHEQRVDGRNSAFGRPGHDVLSREMSRTPEHERPRWLVVGAVIGAGIAAAFQVGKAPVALPQLRATLGLSLVGAGWVVSMFSVLGALAGAMIGAAG